MKALLLIFVSSIALADIKELNCVADLSKQYEGGIQSISLKGSLIHDWIKDAVGTVVYRDYNSRQVLVVGRAKQLESDQNYKPIKHKNSIRFDLSNLTDVKDFSSFNPADQCRILVMIPKNAMSLKYFSAPTQINCDQGGGVTTMQCTRQ